MMTRKDFMIEDVDLNVRYTGKSCASVEHGKIYKCIGIVRHPTIRTNDLLVIDEDDDSYLYSHKVFEIV